GEADFKPILMKRRGPQLVGRIPAKAVSGSALQYYVEARNSAGSVVHAAGSESEPNIIIIDPDSTPQVIGTEEQAASNDMENVAGKLDEELAPLSGTVEDYKKAGRRHSASGGRRFGPLSIAGMV